MEGSKKKETRVLTNMTMKNKRLDNKSKGKNIRKRQKGRENEKKNYLQIKFL
jgi:hypothetical protein